MSTKKKSTKKKTVKKEALIDIISRAYANVKSVPTPGQIRALLQEEHRRKIDYAAARKLQSQLKKTIKLSKTAPAPEPVSKPSGQMRHSHTHGRS